MMQGVKRDAQILHGKSVASLTIAATAFNSPIDVGRVTQVLLGLQHAFEMLLKAALVQNGVKVFDKKSGRSIGFEACLGRAAADPVIKLSSDDAGTLRAIDAMRDDEQHWFNEVSEQLLYRYARAAVTLFDELLERAFKDRLVNYLPGRVLPISTDAPRDLTLLLDEEFGQIADLLKPGRRARDKARARIRTLLAMEAHEDPDTRVSSRDVDRVDKGIRQGKSRTDVFPKLEGLSTSVGGAGLNVQVHFSKTSGAPVRLVKDDLQKKYHRTSKQLADALGLSTHASAALRAHLGVDGDPSCSHEFVFGASRHRAYSDNAFTKMREVKSSTSWQAVWAAHKPTGGRKNERCSDDKCRAG
jgi:hypothetical protein